jgi:hypothetical protein
LVPATPNRHIGAAMRGARISSVDHLVNGGAIETPVIALRQSLWHPISTAPNNHDLELKVLDGGSSVVLTFPCGRTNAGEWINADLEAAIDIRPTKWRPWQKAKARKPQFSTGRDFPHNSGRRWSDT